MGELGVETPTDMPGQEQKQHLFHVAQRVARVARRVPWESKCLVQAMVAQRLLRGYHIESTLYLGVGLDKEKEAGNNMIAHAWVRSGPYHICGGNGEGYAVVAKFKY